MLSRPTAWQANRQRVHTLAEPLARCGYQDYAVVQSVFSLARPKGGGDV
jgi:hypothetical protein